MRIVKQPPDQRNTDIEFVLGLLLIPILLTISVIMLFLPEHWQTHCWFKEYLNIPCPACGGFRALQLICKGDFFAAFQQQPFVITCGIGGIVYFVYACCVVLGRASVIRLKDVTRRDRLLIILGIMLLIAVDWIYVIFL